MLKNFLHRYLPMFLTVVIIATSVFVYQIFVQNNKTADAAWYSSGGTWSYRKAITIDHNKVSGVASSTQSNFPLLFSVTDTDLKFTGSGGKVASSTGADILFTSADGTTKLDHELEKYASTTGETIAWVRIPVLSAVTDTTIYIYFGNASASTQANPTGVWDSSYKGVWHLPNGTSLTASDSTTNANNGTVTGPIATTGRVDGAGDFDGSADNIDVGDVNALDNISKITYSAWVKYDTFSNYDAIFSKWSHSGNGFNFGLSESAYCNNNNKSFLIWQSSTTPEPDETGIACTSADGLGAGIWYYTTYVFDGTASGNANRMKIYINGLNQTLTFAASAGTVTQDNGDTLQIGRGQKSDTLVTDGIIDEARVSVTNRSADWIATEYNNQNLPSTFYSYGALGTSGRQDSSGQPAAQVKTRGGVKFR